MDAAGRSVTCLTPLVAADVAPVEPHLAPDPPTWQAFSEGAIEAPSDASPVSWRGQRPRSKRTIQSGDRTIEGDIEVELA